MRMLKVLSALALALLLTTPAAAAPFAVTDYDLGEVIEVHSLLLNGHVETFRLQVEFDGVAGTSFCVDVAQYIGTSTYDFTAHGLAEASALTGLTYEPAAFLFDSYADELASLSGPELSAGITGLQIAMWETLYETSGSFAPGSGTFVASASTAALEVAAGLLSELGPLPSELPLSGDSTVLFAYSPEYQDQLVRFPGVPGSDPVPAPEPAGTLLLLAGLAVVAGRLRAS